MFSHLEANFGHLEAIFGHLEANFGHVAGKLDHLNQMVNLGLFEGLVRLAIERSLQVEVIVSLRQICS